MFLLDGHFVYLHAVFTFVFYCVWHNQYNLDVNTIYGIHIKRE